MPRTNMLYWSVLLSTSLSKGQHIARDRIDWQRHAARSVQEDSFHRKYRMSQRPSFDQLVEVLKPQLQRDVSHGARESGVEWEEE